MKGWLVWIRPSIVCPWITIVRFPAQGSFHVYVTDDFGDLVPLPRDTWIGVILP